MRACALSTALSTMTLLSSILASSLNCIGESKNPMSSGKLLAAFLDVDEDDSGVLDANELNKAIQHIGIHGKQLEKLHKSIKSKQDATGSKELSFASWCVVNGGHCVL